MIETLIIDQGKQIKAVYWDLPMDILCQNKGVACHQGEMSF
jgi:hypothetical protein